MLKINPMQATINAGRHMQTYVSASSNLSGTPNELSAKRLAAKIEKFVDKDTRRFNVNSYLKARGEYPKPTVAAPVTPEVKVAEVIIPENSINYIG